MRRDPDPASDSSLFERLSRALGAIDVRSLDTLVVLGSGMGGAFHTHEIELLPVTIDSTVTGHAGALALTRRPGEITLLSLGRQHRYEGVSMVAVQQIVRVAAALGARNLIVTNAAGGLDPNFSAGDVMLITDIVSYLLGRCIFSDFAPMLATETSATSLSRINRPGPFAGELYEAIAEETMRYGVAVRRGVYAGVLGPSYETRAEIRMLRRSGADAVGMSTIPEVAAATALGMRVIGISLITNILTDTSRVQLDHDEVVEQGLRSQNRVRAVIEACLAVLGRADNRS